MVSDSENLNPANASLEQTTNSALGKTKDSGILDWIIDTKLLKSSWDLIQISDGNALLIGAATIGLLAGTVDAGFNVASLGGKAVTKNVAKKTFFVIGENMDRVKAFAKETGASYYKSRGNLERDGAAKLLSNNERWVKDQIRMGKTPVDIGIDPNRNYRTIPYHKESTEWVPKYQEKYGVRQ